MTTALEALPRCPKCFRSDNVRPLSIGLVDGYPRTVDYECSACAKVFQPPPKRVGIVNMEQMS